MTYLELCQRLRQECGIAGTGPAAVTGQTGELKRVVDWIASAYSYICAKHANWKFLRSSFSLNTVSGTEAYTPTECTDSVVGALIGHATVGNFGRWMEHTFRIYLQSAGVATQQHFWPLDYEHFRDRYQLQAPANAQPAEFTVRPRDNALFMGPKPNAVYVVSGDYYRAAPALTANDDTPLFPARFHEAIVYMAKLKYAGHVEDGGVYVESHAEWLRLIGPLEMDQLPLLQLGQPLA